MCKDDAAAETADGVTRRLSLPTDATRVVPPVPLPRRSPSTAQEWESANNSQNRASCAAASGLFVHWEIGDGVNAKWCQDSPSVCSTVDLSVHENDTVQVSNVDSSATDGSFSTDCKQVADIAAVTDGTAKHSISQSTLPAKPPRSKRPAEKELPENKNGLDVDKISSMTVISVSEVKSGGDSETSPVHRSERLLPQPKPRLSRLGKSAALELDETDEKHSHNELAVEDHPETSKDFTCQIADSDHIASITAEGKMNEKDRQTSDCQKLHEHVHNDNGSAESGQNLSLIHI